jgi:hypothetical protein
MEAKTNERNPTKARLLGVDTVAGMLGLTKWGVIHLDRTGRLKSVKQSGRRYWLADEVDGYVERLRTERA